MLEFSKLAVAFAVELGGVQHKWDPGYLLDNLLRMDGLQSSLSHNPFIYLWYHCENQLMGI